MNYLNIYNNLITSRLDFQTERSALRKKKEAYFESHHIVPKCMNGSDDKSNLILLTAKEHYIAHWLLWKIYKTGPLANAIQIMTITDENKSYMRSSRLYEKVRIEIATYLSDTMKEYRKNSIHPSTLMKGERHWNYGRKHSEEHKKALSVARAGDRHWNYGKEIPDEVKSKISQSLKGRKTPEEHLPAILAGLKKAQEIRRNKDHSYWRMNHTTVAIWQIADLIYLEWISANKPGSRKLGYIIEQLSQKYSIETPSRNETMLRYFREHGNPADNEDWCKKYKS